VGSEASEGQSAAEAGRLGLLEVGVRMPNDSFLSLTLAESCRCGNINLFREACNKCQASKEDAQNDKLRVEVSGTRNCLFDWMVIEDDEDSDM